MTTKSLPLTDAHGDKPRGSPETKGNYAFVSLGCPKNTVDSERMLGKLAQDGYALQPDADGADVVVVNTCGFIEPARQESLAVIREMLALKKAGKVGAVVVAGCMAERQRDVLLEQVPEVDQIVGVFGREEIARVVSSLQVFKSSSPQPGTGAAGRPGNLRLDDLTTLDLFPPAPVRALEDTARLRITPRHYAYLKISEGCDRLCTYCAIPKMRGGHVTKPIEEVIREANELAADGVRELIVVAQDTTYYGTDLYGRTRLAELLRELDKVDGLEWVRILYAYPEHVSDELIDTLAGADKIVPYLDMPLQHISDRVLRRMIRRVDRGATEQLLHRLRSRWPDLAIRTTFIAGFPGETDAEFEELRRFGRRLEIRACGRVPVLARTRHAGREARRAPAGGREAGASRGDHGSAARGRVRVGRGPGRQGASGGDRRSGPGVRKPRPRADLRRRAGDRLRRAGEGEEPATGRLREGQGDRRRRLRPRRPSRRTAVVIPVQVTCNAIHHFHIFFLNPCE
jgi:ribosomal protein S12 methylthiotransferase